MLSDTVWARRVFQPRVEAPAGSHAPDGGPEQVWVSFQPPFHTMDRKSVWAMIFVGGKVGIHQDSHGKETLWRDFRELGPDRILASPAFWKQLQTDWEIAGGTAQAAAEILQRLGGKVHTGNVSGAKPSLSLIAFMTGHLGFKKPPGNNYSSSEAHLVLSNGEVDSRNGVRVKLADVPGIYYVAEQHTGELLVNSPTMFSGYCGNPDATREAIACDSEGVAWYRTGDVARVVLAEDGSVVYGRDGETPKYHIVDRVNSVVKMASGEFLNPSATEVKLVALASDIFDEVFVDARSGQDRVCLIAVPKDKWLATGPDELLAIVQARAVADSAHSLESFEAPKGLIKVSADEFAGWSAAGLLTPLGKFVRGAISKHYEAALNSHYGFRFREKCQVLLCSTNVREQLLGVVALMVEVDPSVVESYDGNFNSLGLNSLGAARLSATLKEERFNKRCLSAANIANMNLDGLVECVRTGAVTVHAQEELLHTMEEDSALPEELRAQIAAQLPSDAPLSTVLVTGATGALGSAIVAEILRYSPTIRVLCLVRAGTAIDARKRLLPLVCAAAGVESLSAKDSQRLVAVRGSLDYHLGMDEAEYAELAISVNVVIHCAAVVNHVQPYAAHWDGNVKGTLHVLQFVADGGNNAALHFMSTSNVVGSTVGAAVLENTPPRIGQSAVTGLNGYMQSKLVSELLCWEAAAAGLPVAIYRAGIVSSHRENGYCKPEDFYPRLLQAIVSEKVYPAVDPDATYDMTPLDWVARGIAHVALSETAARMCALSTPTTSELVYHTIAKSTHQVPFRTLVNGVLASGLAKPTQVEFAEFVRRMEGVAMFAPLLHELRPAGRCTARWLDATRWEGVVRNASPPMPPSEVTPDVVARCLAFCQRLKQ